MRLIKTGKKKHLTNVYEVHNNNGEVIGFLYRKQEYPWHFEALDRGIGKTQYASIKFDSSTEAKIYLANLEVS